MQEILDEEYPGWTIKTASLGEDGNGRFLWGSIKDFLDKYPVYVADFRGNNLNVPLEAGYILGKLGENAKIIIILSEDQKISDLSGMIRVSKKENGTKAGVPSDVAAKAQDSINKRFKESLKEQLKHYLQ